MSTSQRCHCGSEKIPLFQSYVCKAECDLPLSMRTVKPLTFVESPAYKIGDLVWFVNHEYILTAARNSGWYATRLSDGLYAFIETRHMTKAVCQYFINRAVKENCAHLGISNPLTGIVSMIDRLNKTFKVEWSNGGKETFPWDTNQVVPL